MRLRACNALVDRDMTHRAIGFLEKLQRHPRVATRARRLLAMTRYMSSAVARLDLANASRSDPRWEALDGSALGNVSDDTGLLVWSRAGTDKVVLIFSHVAGGFGPLRTVASTAIVHRAIEQVAASIVYVRDPSGGLNLAGVRGLAPDYEGCVVALRALCARKGWRHVYTMGPSSGGYAALRYGLDLGARGVLSMSGFVHLEPPVAPVLQPFYKRAPHMAVDLLPLYRAHPSPPRVMMCYGEKHERDAASARRMAELPGTELIAAPDFDDHSTLIWAIAERTLQPLVGRLIANA
jgi:hypothetical protein